MYDRLKLQNGDRLNGPAILEEPDSTTICPFGYSVSVDPPLNLLIKKDQTYACILEQGPAPK